MRIGVQEVFVTSKGVVDLLDESEFVNSIAAETRRHFLSALLEGAQLLAHLKAGNVVDDI
jgi:hypothetical protein